MLPGLLQDINANSVSLTKSGQFKEFLQDLDYSIYKLCVGAGPIRRLSTRYTLIWHPQDGNVSILGQRYSERGVAPSVEAWSRIFFLQCCSLGSLFRRVDHGETMDKVKKALNSTDAYIANSVKTGGFENLKHPSSDVLRIYGEVDGKFETTLAGDVNVVNGAVTSVGHAIKGPILERAK
ncbi:hypothetical protein F5887DRAFT_256745 [Amanita rubescens]|nr:hypothetical protein F5887DRAFT_256745 [Amanita rubescens]